jgi:hypothetical protein
VKAFWQLVWILAIVAIIAVAVSGRADDPVRPEPKSSTWVTP